MLIKKSFNGGKTMKNHFIKGLIFSLMAVTITSTISLTSSQFITANAGKTTSSIIGKAHKKDTGWFTKHNYVMPKGSASKSKVAKAWPDGQAKPGRHPKGTNVTLNSGKVYTFKNNYKVDNFYAYATNGHRVYFKPGKYTYATEVMPGLYTPKHNFTNNTGHWVIYFVTGNGVKGDGDYAGHNVSTPVKGFKPFYELYDPIAGKFPIIGECVATESGNLLYNWKKKILISTPSINNVNYGGYGVNPDLDSTHYFQGGDPA